MSAAAILLFAHNPFALAADPSPKAAPASSSNDDYYTRRAKGILKAERDAAVKPHPLAASYPGMDVVVCEAGCPDRKGPEVVFARRGKPPAEVEVTREAMMVPTSASADPADPAFAASPDVVCIGGCYGDTIEPVPRPTARATGLRTVKSTDLPPRDKLSPIR